MNYKIHKEDISASVVVFLVALPLCLGISLASGTPLVTGLIAGIIGGIVVGILSNSALGVSGPAAGLVAICIAGISKLGGFDKFLVSVIIAGFLQVVFGVLKGGKLSYFFPSSVINGMLSAIGIIIILKQLPHAVGYDKDYEGDMAFLQPDQENTFSEIIHAWKYFHAPSVFIFLLGIGIIIIWNVWVRKRFPVFSGIIQAPLMVVISGILVVRFLMFTNSENIQPEHLVNIPSMKELINEYKYPKWITLRDINVWYYGFIIAFVASIETLLCTEATDNLDPQKRITNRNRELIAQGIGNMFSGFLGGVPITQVIVRSNANITFGAKTKISAILHGIWLLLSILFLREWLNYIPLSALACILIVVGFNLSHPSIFKKMYKKKWKEFIPFIVTIIAVIFTDLLIGTLTGLLVTILIQFYLSSLRSVEFRQIENNYWVMNISDTASFMNKSKILSMFNELKKNDTVEVFYNGNDTDIIELLHHQKNILNSREITCHLNLKTNIPYENIKH